MGTNIKVYLFVYLLLGLGLQRKLIEAEHADAGAPRKDVCTMPTSWDNTVDCSESGSMPQAPIAET